jgi:hypothetical protein
MPKPHTFPFIFDEARCISISELKKWKYLEMGSIKSGTINWRNRYNEITSRLPIRIVFTENEQYLNLNYKCNDNDYDYNIRLISTPSNIGKGRIWCFLCPFTHKRCRKLHLIDERFMHRSALPSGVYSKQIHTKKWRDLEKVYGNYFDVERYYEELYSKHFKKFYNGKPTKRYLKLLEKINDAERFSASDIERLFML